MEFGIHRKLLTRESFNRRNLGRLLAVSLIIASLTSIGYLLLELRAESLLRQTAESNASELENQITTIKALYAAKQSESQAACEDAQKGQEERVGAFAKQAAKCVPLMQKFGIQ